MTYYRTTPATTDQLTTLRCRLEEAADAGVPGAADRLARLNGTWSTTVAPEPFEVHNYAEAARKISDLEHQICAHWMRTTYPPTH